MIAHALWEYSNLLLVVLSDAAGPHNGDNRDILWVFIADKAGISASLGFFRDAEWVVWVKVGQ
ncbi:hypothetical protein KDI_52600 [Dictyobacter arantiisoli]|uniref:Uncharacterized protein n=1 Tax=Dictyobacter arantiisoli TaxID=2014874 RepID=A0A5A5TKS7_9CHLR|nr:hypothetical protein KDI_52600 [Dictyobacter arantiisoli]